MPASNGTKSLFITLKAEERTGAGKVVFRGAVFRGGGLERVFRDGRGGVEGREGRGGLMIIIPVTRGGVDWDEYH